MSRNVSSSGKHPSLRRHVLPALIRTLAVSTASLGLFTSVSAAGSWDCRAAADGSWQCAQADVAQPRPADAHPLHAGPAASRDPALPSARQSKPAAKAPAVRSGATAGTVTVKPLDRSVPPAPANTNRNPPALRKAAAGEPVKPAPPAESPLAAKTAREADRHPPLAPPEPPETRSRSPSAGVAGTGQVHLTPADGDLEPGPVDAGIANTNKNHTQLDKGIAWSNCAPLPVVPDGGDDRQLPVHISADSAEATNLGYQAFFRGDVEIRQGTQSILAREARYDHGSGEMQASGDALLIRPDLRIAADGIHYNLQSGEGEAEAAEYRLPGILARGNADRAVLVDSSNSRFSHIDYTTCPPGDSAWKLAAEELQLDTGEGWGKASDATLYFADIPVMYAPVLTFPIDDRRRSGLLIPTLGYGDRHGVDLSVPYYFNLAPNYDLTLAPRLMSKRGLLLDGEFRFLTSAHRGEIRGSYMPHDRLAPAGVSQRGGLSLRTHSRHTGRLSSSLNINHVSDNDFLEDFGSDIETYGVSHLERAGTLNYQGDDWTASVALQQFQTIDPALAIASRPYSVLPRIRLRTADRLNLSFPSNFTFGAEIANFHKDDSVVEGRRLDLNPRLEVPFRQSWYHLTPAAGLRYTRYELDNQTPGRDSSPDRLAPMLSLDSGLYFDRDMHWFGRGATQSLEPRAFYLFVPEQEQDDIPVFDTGNYGLSFDNLFRENRFTSADRVGDANQLTLAVTSTVSDLKSGEQLMRASLGGIVYLEDRAVQLPGAATETDRTSPLIAEVSAMLNRQWRTRGELVWNPHSNDVQQALARASYRADRDHIFSAAYRLRNTTNSETDLAAIWPLGSQTRAIARWNYSLSGQHNLDALAGIEYGRCCWKLRTLLRQQVTGTGDAQNLSFLVQLELRGLGKFGDDIDSLLKDGIYGYRRNDD